MQNSTASLFMEYMLIIWIITYITLDKTPCCYYNKKGFWDTVLEAVFAFNCYGNHFPGGTCIIIVLF